MTTVAVGVYMVRYPLGGMLSWGLQWVAGFAKLGLNVLVVEKSAGPDDCYDPRSMEMTDDCSFGIETLTNILEPFGLSERWCYVDAVGEYHGMSREAVEKELSRADVFLDLGTHGTWLPEVADAGVRVFLDGEPGYRQMKWELDRREGRAFPEYDRYFTNGLNVGTESSSAPTVDLTWEPMPNPVRLDLFPVTPPPPDGAYTSVMNWESHPPVVFEGVTYGQKNVEFQKIMEIPKLTDARLEVAVVGRNVPHDELVASGWSVASAHDTTVTLDSYKEYLRASKGEFSVCKEVFVAHRTGWFSDRSAAYLATGRPVILQETGFSTVLPCGQGLFAYSSPTEAVSALDAIESDLSEHSAAARAIAEDRLSTDVVLPQFLSALGL